MYKWYGYKNADNASFWEDHWNKENLSLQMERAKNSELIPIFQNILPKKGKIIEAGCGQGIFVNVLNKIGYDIEGIDFSDKTISEIKKQFPNMPVSVGDIFNLKYPHNYFDAYISLGVIEHYENSWEKPLMEANRVLKRGGKILVSVPYYNLYRKIYLPIKDAFGKRRGNQFYAYVFRKKEIEDALKNSGFVIKSEQFYGKSSVLMSMPFLGKILKKYYNHIKGDRKIMRNSNENINFNSKKSFSKKIFSILPNSIFAHMIMVIAEKS